MIALNSTKEAEGELYVDDGKSFDFKQGDYIHRRFVFKNGKLTSSNLGPAPPSAKFGFHTDCVIERIIIIGHGSVPKTALIGPAGNQKSAIELGPLWLQQGRSVPAALTIRKPGVSVSEDWSIEIL